METEVSLNSPVPAPAGRCRRPRREQVRRVERIHSLMASLWSLHYLRGRWFPDGRKWCAGFALDDLGRDRAPASGL